MKLLARVSASLLLLAAALVPAAAAPHMLVVELGVLPGDTHSIAVTVNAHGEIPGYSYTMNGDGSTGPIHGFVWRKGRLNALPALGGDQSRGWGVNDRGVVVGWARTANGETHAAAWVPAGRLRARDLGTLPGGTYSSAWEINNRGDIVGEARTADGASHAVLWPKGGAIRDLGVLPGDTRSVATDINDAGVIVGWSSTPSPGGTSLDQHPAVWRNGIPAALPSLYNDGRGLARRINSKGQVVGLSYDAVGFRHAVLWDADGVHDLGIPPGGDYSAAWGINRKGAIVGERGPEGSWHAIRWAHGGYTDFNALLDPQSGWSWLSTVGINDRGEMVGFGGRDGVSRAFLMLTW